MILNRSKSGTRIERRSVLQIVASMLLLLVCTTTWAQKKESVPQRYEQIYVPIEKIDAILKKHPQGVLLPQSEFEKLYSDAQDAAKKANTTLDEDTIPNGLLINQSTYQVTIEKRELKVSVQCQFSKPKSGWAVVAIPTDGLFLESAKIGEKNAAVAQNGKDRNQALFVTDKTELIELNLEMKAPLSSVGSDLVSKFSLINAPAVQLEIEKPKDKFLVINGIPLGSSEDQDEAKKYSIPLGGLQTAEIKITDQQTGPKAETLVFSRTQYGLYVRPGEVTWQAKNELQVFGRGIDTVQINVPKTLEIADVDSVGLESWKLEDDPELDDATRIVLKYRQAFTEIKSITLKGVMTTEPDEPWQFPVLNVRGAASQVGRALIQVPHGIRVEQAEAEGARPAFDASLLSSNARQRTYNQLIYDIWKPEANLSFSTQEKKRHVQSAVTTVVQLEDDAPQLQVITSVETYFAPLFQFHFELPADWTVTTIKRDGRDVLWQIVPAEAGVNLIEVNLKKPLKQGETMQLMLSARQEAEKWPVEEESITFTLPQVKLPDVDILEGSYAIVSGKGLEVIPGELVGLEPVKLNLANERLGYAYRNGDFEGTLELKRKPSRIAAQTTLISRLDRKSYFDSSGKSNRYSGGWSS